ncbi:hypothetical protein ACIOMM_35410 [Streptomyces sp. NPDC087908]|uniref:hypothetical protein n=1 Tax=Streptomyces sp. NPDC087908 TaxID=3365820 RepID=UPI0038125387
MNFTKKLGVALSAAGLAAGSVLVTTSPALAGASLTSTPGGTFRSPAWANGIHGSIGGYGAYANEVNGSYTRKVRLVADCSLSPFTVASSWSTAWPGTTQSLNTGTGCYFGVDGYWLEEAPM